MDKIMHMLKSEDPELINLAINTLFGMYTNEQLLEIIPKFGHVSKDTKELFPDEPDYHKEPLRVSGKFHKMWIRGDIVVALRYGCLMCRNKSDYKEKTIKSATVVEDLNIKQNDA